jgi:hypothetical protein
MTPEFPNYHDPVQLPEQQQSTIPQGIRTVDPKYNKPLMKIMKRMMPKKLPKMRTGRTRKKKIV